MPFGFFFGLPGRMLDSARPGVSAKFWGNTPPQVPAQVLPLFLLADAGADRLHAWPPWLTVYVFLMLDKCSCGKPSPRPAILPLSGRRRAELYCPICSKVRNSYAPIFFNTHTSPQGTGNPRQRGIGRGARLTQTTQFGGSFTSLKFSFCS